MQRIILHLHLAHLVYVLAIQPLFLHLSSCLISIISGIYVAPNFAKMALVVGFLLWLVVLHFVPLSLPHVLQTQAYSPHRSNHLRASNLSFPQLS